MPLCCHNIAVNIAVGFWSCNLCQSSHSQPYCSHPSCWAARAAANCVDPVDRCCTAAVAANTSVPGELVLSMVTSIPNLGGGSFNPIGNMGGSLGGSGLGSVLFGGSGLGSNLFGGSNFGSSLLRGSSLGGNLLGGGIFTSNLFGGSSSGDGNGMTEIIDVLGSDIPFSTGSFLLDTKGATVPAKLDNMLKTTGLSPEESSMLDITAHSIGLAAGISIALAAGLLTVFYSGWLLEESLRLITGPYNWGLTVQQTWNNALNLRER
ncbi:hypothetical protein DUNSADRAFT_16930 [Dunaliella salina]|uniref:Encoded protein n=2 Tax=Dunaliella salina TaxID=3046 RepID=A0ABQ7H0J7_DUNSA|nr:hypothetical protein DUNSADRAFT_16930 [Dunaliella salina]|eukprot:KAF5840384.1 hypothetical protein DUNSADRAFT_16930 [Dunaliella salina]